MLRENEEPEETAIVNWRDWVSNYWDVPPIQASVKRRSNKAQEMIDEDRQEACVGKVGKHATGEAAVVGKHKGSIKKS